MNNVLILPVSSSLLHQNKLKKSAEFENEINIWIKSKIEFINQSNKFKDINIGCKTDFNSLENTTCEIINILT